MKREEFVGLFIGYLIKKSSSWLPEESTEEDMLDTVQRRLNEHTTEIRKVLYRSNGGENKRHDD